MVELLSTCPTNWGMTPDESRDWIEERMLAFYPLGDYKVSSAVAELKILGGGPRMQQNVIIAGFGGQGVLFAGQLLSYTAMDEGKAVTWIPSYGPEMRGGTANCTVVISDEEIGSPFVKNPTAVSAMNLPSLDKFEDLVEEGGVLVVNSSMVDRPVRRR